MCGVRDSCSAYWAGGVVDPCDAAGSEGVTGGVPEVVAPLFIAPSGFVVSLEAGGVAPDDIAPELVSAGATAPAVLSPSPGVEFSCPDGWHAARPKDTNAATAIMRVFMLAPVVRIAARMASRWRERDRYRARTLWSDASFPVSPTRRLASRPPAAPGSCQTGLGALQASCLTLRSLVTRSRAPGAGHRLAGAPCRGPSSPGKPTSAFHAPRRSPTPGLSVRRA